MVSYYTRRSYVSCEPNTNGYLYITRSKVMIVHAYVFNEAQQGVEDMRIIHMLKTLNPKEHDVRIYVLGQDFHKVDVEHELPFATLDGKKKSFDNLWNEVIGEKIHDTDF